MGTKTKEKFSTVQKWAGLGGNPSPITTYYLILVPTIVLIVIGFVMVFSASTVIIINQGDDPYRVYLHRFVMMAVGVIGLFLAMRLPEGFWRKISLVGYLVTLGFQLLVKTPLGVASGGNTNWIQFPGLPAMQPSEFLKIGVALLIGWVLTKSTIDRENPLHVGVNVGVPVMLAVGGVMLGHDMGTALVFASLVIGALVAAKIPRKWYGYLLVFGAVASTYLVFSNPSRIARVKSVLPGFRDDLSPAVPTQEQHALWALGSGGLTGVGPGASKEKWNYLAEAHTDFIFAILGEEFGLIGTLFVVACFGVLLYGMFRLIIWHKSDYARIVTGGIAMWIAMQTLINMASVTHLGPVIGVPLPLISTGGSAFIATCGALGIVLSFARGDSGMEKAFGIRNLLRARRTK